LQTSSRSAEPPCSFRASTIHGPRTDLSDMRRASQLRGTEATVSRLADRLRQTAACARTGMNRPGESGDSVVCELQLVLGSCLSVVSRLGRVPGHLHRPGQRHRGFCGRADGRLEGHRPQRQRRSHAANHAVRPDGRCSHSGGSSRVREWRSQGRVGGALAAATALAVAPNPRRNAPERVTGGTQQTSETAAFRFRWQLGQ
jgi:hypothetical protein